jgi:type VI secretion system protein ImpA
MTTMSTIDTKALLAPITGADPAGQDLEYDPDFLALQEAAAGVPERRMGDSLVAAQDPDWRRVIVLGSELLSRSKDLRIAIPVTRALLQTHGLPGLHEGLGLVHGLVAHFWDGLHPELDATDDNDPTARLNCLLELTDRDGFLAQVRGVPLIRSRVFGPVAWRDIEIAEGKIAAPPDRQALDGATISGAFQDCDLADLTAATTAVDGAMASVLALNAALTAHLAASRTPDLAPLQGLLTQVRDVLQDHLDARQPGVTAPGVAPAPGVTPTAPPPATTTPGQIRTREDVVLTLDRLCDYYSQHEPSSPVPLLLKRARRLATGSFLDIMRDLAPDALSQIERVCGIEEPS